MPIQSAPFPPLPRDTARAAEAAFGKGHIYLTIGDQMEPLLAEVDLTGLTAATDKPAATLALLALVTAFQAAENLPDHRAAEAVRTRTDWKYALHLPLDGPGFDPLMLCEFRQHALRDPAAQHAFQQVLDHLAEIGLLRRLDHQRAEAAEVLIAVCTMSRLERLAEAMRITLEALAVRQPEWLRMITLPHWYERYNRVLATPLLPHCKKGQEDLARAIGMDARYLLDKIGGSPTALARLPEVQSLWREWQQQFNQSAHEARWRSPLCTVCSGRYGSLRGETQ
jgi:transposase